MGRRATGTLAIAVDDLGRAFGVAEQLPNPLADLPVSGQGVP